MNNKLSSKLLFCSPNIWRKLFLYQKNTIFKTGEKFVYTRTSIVPQALINYNIRIYVGKGWHNRFMTKWSVGFKFGEFTWNRKIALYKAKQLKKKK